MPKIVSKKRSKGKRKTNKTSESNLSEHTTQDHPKIFLKLKAPNLQSSNGDSSRENEQQETQQPGPSKIYLRLPLPRTVTESSKDGTSTSGPENSTQKRARSPAHDEEISELASTSPISTRFRVNGQNRRQYKRQHREANRERYNENGRRYRARCWFRSELEIAINKI